MFFTKVKKYYFPSGAEGGRVSDKKWYAFFSTPLPLYCDVSAFPWIELLDHLAKSSLILHLTSLVNSRY